MRIRFRGEICIKSSKFQIRGVKKLALDNHICTYNVFVKVPVQHNTDLTNTFLFVYTRTEP